MKTTPATAAAWGQPHASSLAIAFCFAFSVAIVGVMPSSPLKNLGGLAPPTATGTSAAVVDTDTNLAPAPPFYLHAASAAEAQRAVRCLTDAIYYEAANQPEEGQRAIAQVIINRVRDPHFPKSVCGVVYEGWQRHTGCQFSFVCDGSLHRRRAVPAVWEGLTPIAEAALNGYVVPEVGSATHYYAQYVQPNWEGTVDKITQIGAHIFCSWQGRAGYVSSLDETYQGGEFDISDAVLDGDYVAPAPVHVTKVVEKKTVARRRIRRVTGRLRVAARDDRGHGRA